MAPKPPPDGALGRAWLLLNAPIAQVRRVRTHLGVRYPAIDQAFLAWSAQSTGTWPRPNECIAIGFFQFDISVRLQCAALSTSDHRELLPLISRFNKLVSPTVPGERLLVALKVPGEANTLSQCLLLSLFDCSAAFLLGEGVAI